MRRSSLLLRFFLHCNRSSLVQKILLAAHAEGKQFSVIVVDSRPLNEGKTLLKALTSVQPPIPCTYTLLSAIPAVISQASTVFLGAHSLHANGAVYSRAGTALVAMMAKAHGIPVLVSCETYKYSETVMLDGFGKNELGTFVPIPLLSQAHGIVSTIDIFPFTSTAKPGSRDLKSSLRCYPTKQHNGRRDRSWHDPSQQHWVYPPCFGRGHSVNECGPLFTAVVAFAVCSYFL